MKDTVRLFAALVALTALCIGCSKTEGPEPGATPAPNAAEAENWEPASADLPAGHSADDGHDHSANAKKVDHSGHNH
jgi:hypothetical protein